MTRYLEYLNPWVAAPTGSFMLGGVTITPSNERHNPTNLAMAEVCAGALVGAGEVRVLLRVAQSWAPVWGLEPLHALRHVGGLVVLHGLRGALDLLVTDQ